MSVLSIFFQSLSAIWKTEQSQYAEKRFASMGMVDKAEKIFFALLLIVSGSF